MIFLQRKYVPLIVVLVAGAGSSAGQTSVLLGAGSAVHRTDRLATFDALAHNGTPLSDYTEGGLFIGTDGDSWVGDGAPRFDPFHGADGTDAGFYFPYGGSQGWTVIRAADGVPIFALEFMYGNGWTTGDIYGQYPWGIPDGLVSWQTRRHNAVVSSGLIGDSPWLPVGTVVGFSDPSGFDELRVKCTSSRSGDPSLQALALDTVAVQLSWISCPADFNGDGFVDIYDFTDFVTCFEGGDCPPGTSADFNGDGFADIYDFTDFVTAFETGC